MPSFKYDFRQDNKNIADIMVSGALYSLITLMGDSYYGNNPIKSIDLDNRYLTVQNSGDLVLILISDNPSTMLKSQLDQFARRLELIDLYNEFDELTDKAIEQIFSELRNIFHLIGSDLNRDKFHVYSSFLSQY